MRRGFTLIELLIVIAIILILIAIALPNFMNARIRAKVLETQANFKTIDEAIHFYANDYEGGLAGLKWGCNSYSWWWDCDLVGQPGSTHGSHTSMVMVFFEKFNPGVMYMGWVLTTPSQYIEKIPIDWFNTRMGDTPGAPSSVRTFGYPASAMIQILAKGANTGDGHPWEEVWWPGYIENKYPHLTPTFVYFLISSGPDYLWHSMVPSGEPLYSPTNGARSDGDIWRFSDGKHVP